MNRLLPGALVALVSLAACTSTQDRSAPPSDVLTKTQGKRYDQPGEANEFFARRRLAPGMREIPVERLLSGYEQMKRMEQYSSATGQHFRAHWTRIPGHPMQCWQPGRNSAPATSADAPAPS
ncbi:MAG: hypothetical protein IPK97_11990 [Ahniella sp.]|nr:hypothetical protein [Ahniella sp.]